MAGRTAGLLRQKVHGAHQASSLGPCRVKGRTNEAPSGGESKEPYGYWLHHGELSSGPDRDIVRGRQLEASEKLNIAPVPHPPRERSTLGGPSFQPWTAIRVAPRPWVHTPSTPSPTGPATARGDVSAKASRPVRRVPRAAKRGRARGLRRNAVRRNARPTTREK